MRSLLDYFLPVFTMAGIDNSGTRSQPVCIADAGKVYALAVNVLGPNPIDADVSFDIRKNGADTGSDFVIPDGTAVGAGVVVHPNGSTVWVANGDSIEIESNGEQLIQCSIAPTFIIRR